MVLEPIYETDFSPYSFGFRPNRSTHDAIKATYLAMSGQKKMFWVIDADIKGFFDNVDHQRLEQIIQDRITDQKLRNLIWAFLRAGVMEEGICRHSKVGTPQGGIVSPLLANVYLNELDQWARQWTDLSSWEKTKRRRRGKGNWRYVRYADDFLFLTNGGRKHAEVMMRRLEAFVDEELNLTLSRKKTTLTHANDGFDFLGYHLERRRGGNGEKTVRWTIPKDAVRDLKSDVRAATDGGTGISVRTKIKALNMKLRGWANYYKYATDAARTFNDLDHFVWKRLMNWLATKYRSTVPKVIENQLDSKSPISINGQTLKTIGDESAIYRASYKDKDHPYLTDATDQPEEPPSGELPPEDPWLGNVEWRPGWSDQRWRALERDEWTCQRCGADLVDKPASVHHQCAYAEYSCEERANSLENLISLCAGCHREVEAN